MKIAIITARGGSKRIPRKNIKKFCGKPIILYSIEAALKSEFFDEVMVSTDSAEIAEIAHKAGAKMPFMRSKKTSNDYAGTNDVIAEVLEEYEKRGKIFGSFCCIYPTAPFITAEKLRESAKLLYDECTYTVVPVVKYSFPPQRSIVIRNGFAQMQFPEINEARSQDLEPIYHDCGQFYWGKTKPFMKSKILIGNKTRPFILPESEVQDIDNEDDWKLAELKFNFFQNK